jgi:hypothetical protein
MRFSLRFVTFSFPSLDIARILPDPMTPQKCRSGTLFESRGGFIEPPATPITIENNRPILRERGLNEFGVSKSEWASPVTRERPFCGISLLNEELKVLGHQLLKHHHYCMPSEKCPV